MVSESGLLHSFALWLLAIITPQSPSADPLFAARFLSFDTGNQPNCVAIGDLNGDGQPDLAVANAGSSKVSVLLGNGDGTFGPKTDFVTRREPNSVAIGDLNGDGRLDLAVANHEARVPVRLAIYDVRGRLLWSSERSVRDPGEHTQLWARSERQACACREASASLGSMRPE